MKKIIKMVNNENLNNSNNHFDKIIKTLIISMILLTVIIYMLCIYNILLNENYKFVLTIFLTKNSNLDSVIIFLGISVPLLISYLHFGSLSNGLISLCINTFLCGLYFLILSLFKEGNINDAIVLKTKIFTVYQVYTLDEKLGWLKNALNDLNFPEKTNAIIIKNLNWDRINCYNDLIFSLNKANLEYLDLLYKQSFSYKLSYLFKYHDVYK